MDIFANHGIGQHSTRHHKTYFIDYENIRAGAGGSNFGLLGSDSGGSARQQVASPAQACSVGTGGSANGGSSGPSRAGGIGIGGTGGKGGDAFGGVGGLNG